MGNDVLQKLAGLVSDWIIVVLKHGKQILSNNMQKIGTFEKLSTVLNLLNNL